MVDNDSNNEFEKFIAYIKEIGFLYEEKTHAYELKNNNDIVRISLKGVTEIYSFYESSYNEDDVGLYFTNAFKSNKDMRDKVMSHLKNSNNPKVKAYYRKQRIKEILNDD